MVRAVFFDLGGVILSSPFDAFASYEQRSALPPGLIRTLNATNPDTNAWARLERGELDVDAFAAVFAAEAAALGHDVDGREVLQCLAGELRPEMIDLVRRCGAAGLVTAILTNNFLRVDSHPDHARVAALVDHLVESSVVGVRKPEPRFYEIACELAGVAPREVVFLDDLGINLKPARAMGMTTVKVTDPATAIAEVEAILGSTLG